MDDAACLHAGVDPDLWYAEHENTFAYRFALSICRRCPVQHECLDDALRRRDLYGMWGGLSAMQRRRLLEGRQSCHA